MARIAVLPQSSQALTSYYRTRCIERILDGLPALIETVPLNMERTITRSTSMPRISSNINSDIADGQIRDLSQKAHT